MSNIGPGQRARPAPSTSERTLAALPPEHADHPPHEDATRESKGRPSEGSPGGAVEIGEQERTREDNPRHTGEQHRREKGKPVSTMTAPRST